MSRKSNRIMPGLADSNGDQKYIVCYLNIRCWGATSRIDLDQLGVKLSTEEKRLVRALESLLDDRGYLADLNDLRGSAKRFVQRHSIRHSIPGLSVVPQPAITKIDEGLASIKARFDDVVEDFISALPDLESSFAERYPKIYQADKYPTSAQLRSKFYFNWRFQYFTPPVEGDGILSPEIYRRELQKFQSEMREIRDNGIKAIGGQFLSKIDQIRKQCLGGTPNSASVRALHEFFENFDELWGGFIGHDQLKQKIEEAKDYMVGTDAGMLKHDDQFRSMVGNKMKDILESINASGDARLHRDLDI